MLPLKGLWRDAAADKEGQQPAALEQQGAILPCSLWRGPCGPRISNLWPPELRAYNSVVLTQPVCGHWLQLPQETNRFLYLNKRVKSYKRKGWLPAQIPVCTWCVSLAPLPRHLHFSRRAHPALEGCRGEGLALNQHLEHSQVTYGPWQSWQVWVRGGQTPPCESHGPER